MEDKCMEWRQEKDMPVFIIIILGVLCAEFLWLVFDRAYIFFQDRYGLIVCGRED